MTFKSLRDRVNLNKLYADLKIIKFSDMVHLQNVLLLKNIELNKLPDSIINTYTVDLSRDMDFVDFYQIPDVRTVAFGKHSIKYNSMLSWNEIQSLLMPTKLDDFKDLKTGLKKCFLASYHRPIKSRKCKRYCSTSKPYVLSIVQI